MTPQQISLLKRVLSKEFHSSSKWISKDIIGLTKALKEVVPEIPGEFIQQMETDWNFEYNRNQEGIINETK